MMSEFWTDIPKSVLVELLRLNRPTTFRARMLEYLGDQAEDGSEAAERLRDEFVAHCNLLDSLIETLRTPTRED